MSIHYCVIKSCPPQSQKYLFALGCCMRQLETMQEKQYDQENLKYGEDA